MLGSNRGNGLATSLVKWILGPLGILAVIIGVAYGLDWQASYEQEARHRSSDYAEHAAKQIRQSCFNVATAQHSNCLQQAATEYRLQARDNQREYDDLAAQRTSALWTSIMGVAALIGMGLSAVGVALVFTTFRETRHANDIAKDTAKRQLRAYVTVEHPSINHHPHEGLIVEYNIVSTNNGITPAKSLRWAGELVLAHDEETEAISGKPWDEAGKSRAIMGAGQSTRMYGNLPSPITAEYQRGLEEGTARIWAFGEIRYFDVFGEEHSTRYRGYYDFQRGFVWDTVGNDAT